MQSDPRSRSRFFHPGQAGRKLNSALHRKVDRVTQGDDLIVDPLVDDASALSNANLARIRKIALSSADLAGRLASLDGRVAGLAINFVKPDKKSNMVAEAVRAVFRTVGHALWTTTVVLSLGFLMFTLSGYEGSWTLGLMVSITIVFGLLTDFLLLPPLLTTLDRKD